MPQYCFLQCVIDTHRHGIKVQGQLVEVQPLIFDLLLYFARNPGRVLPKDELLTSVWGTTFVTDSVIARAVMKARRIIQDAQGSPDVIATVRGVGYRFDAAVILLQDDAVAERAEELQKPAVLAPAPRATPSGSPVATPLTQPTLAILPFANESEDPQLAWAERGLAGLVHHQLETKGRISVASINATGDWRSHLTWGGEALALACQQLGTGKALLCRFSRAASGLYRLEALLGSSDGDLEGRNFEGPDLMELAAKVVLYLDAQLDPGHESTPLFWEEQLAKAFDFELRGELGSALPLLESCMQRLAVTPRMHLVHARLLREQSAAMAHARSAALIALKGAMADNSFDLQVDVYAELCRIEVNSGDMAAAAGYGEQGLALVFTGQASHAVLANMLIAKADMERFQGQFESAAKTALRAAEAAKAVGDVYSELLAHCLYGHVLMSIPLLSKAIQALREVVRETRLRGLMRIELQAYQSLGLGLGALRQYAEAVDATRRASVLATHLGFRGKYLGSRIQETFVLIDAGRLGEAAFTLQECDNLMGGAGPIYLSSAHGRARAHWLWRSGRHEEALLQMQEMLALACQWAWYTRWLCAGLLCSWYLALGREPEAAKMLAVLSDDGNVARRGRCEAALLLHQGKREEAKARLRTAWATGPSEGANGQDLAVDLGWLLLEDKNSAELDFLMRAVNAMSAEHRPTALLQTVYAWRAEFAGDVPAHWRQAWRELLSEMPALRRHAPALGNEGALDLLLGGQLPPMALLLNNACD